MSEEEVIAKVVELKGHCVKVQDFEAAYLLRGIETSFEGSYKSSYIKPTYENLVIELTRVVEELNHRDNPYIIRVIQLFLLFDC